MTNKTFSWEGRCYDGSGLRKVQFYVNVDGTIEDLKNEVKGLDFLEVSYDAEDPENSIYLDPGESLISTATIVVLAEKKEEFYQALLEKGFVEV